MMDCTSLILLICILSLAQPVDSSVGDKCDDDKYEGGCFQQANLECDRVVNLCVCLPGTVRIGNVCWKRARDRESCKYSEQCDTPRAYLCYEVDPRPQLHEPAKECDPASTRCQCLNYHPDEYRKVAELVDNPNLSALSTGDQVHKLAPATIRIGHSQVISSRTRPHNNHTRTKFIWSREDEDFAPQHHGPSNHSNGANIFTRIVWLFLILSLVSLMLLLLIIKYHSSFRDPERPLQRATEDRRSIDSDYDVPPPYEVAIRMKV